MVTTIEAALHRIGASLLTARRDILNLELRSLSIMAIEQELQDKIDQLVAGQAEAKSDAARHEARTNAAIALIQDLKTAIGNLPPPGVVTQAQLDALVAKADAALADMAAANTQRDAADDALGAATA
jgi:hypothetical protein